MRSAIGNPRSALRRMAKSQRRPTANLGAEAVFTDIEPAPQARRGGFGGATPRYHPQWGRQHGQKLDGSRASNDHRRAVHARYDGRVPRHASSEHVRPPRRVDLRDDQDQGNPSVVISTGPVVQRAMKGMRHAIVAMAAQGNNLVVDEVMIGQEAREYRALLSRFDVRLVGLFAPLEVLEARERERGDREIGLARWQFDRVHRDITYDLEIDATATTPLENAQQIRDAFGL